MSVGYGVVGGGDAVMVTVMAVVTVMTVVSVMCAMFVNLLINNYKRSC